MATNRLFNIGGRAQPAGLRRHRVWVDEKIVSQDPDGGEVVEWLPRYQIWAQVSPVSGREIVVNGQIIATVDTIIAALYGPATKDIGVLHRFRFYGKIYNIEVPIDFESQHKTMEFQCTVGANDG